MKKFRTKKILSVICLMALILSFNLNAAALASEVKDEKKITVEENQEVKPTDDKKPEVKPTDEEKPEVKPETKPIDDKKPEVKPEVKPTDDKKPEVKPEIKPTTDKDEATLSCETHYTTFKIYAKNKDGVESLHTEITKYLEKNQTKITFSIKTMFKEVISVTGGDHKLVGDNIVGTPTNEEVKVVVKLDDFVPSTNEIFVDFSDENGTYVVGADPVILYAEPGTVLDYTPPTFPGYKYAGPSKLIAPANGDLSLTYQRIAFDVTVSYVDTKGNKIANDLVLTGKMVDKLNIPIKQVAGYTFKSLSNKNDEGLAEINKSSINYYLTEVNENIVLVYNTNPTVTKTVETKKTLPQTGINKNYAAAVGITLLAVGIFIAFKKEKEY